MSIMFANRSQQAATTGHLLEFQAGRTMIEPGSTPEKWKAVAQPDYGLIYIKHSQDDQLLHFCWKNRKSNNTELDLIIFPGETEFLKINDCKDGRVFMLKFKNSQERHLFWMQESSEEKDDDIRKKMNELLSNAPPTRTPAAQANRNNPLGGFAALSNAIGGNIEDIGALGNMDQNQLMRLFSLMNGGGGNAAELLPHLGQAAGTGNTNQSAALGPLSALMRQGSSQAQQGQGGSGSKETTPKEDTHFSAPGGVSAQMLSQIINSLPAGTSTTDQQQKRALVHLSTMLTRGNTHEVVNKYKDRLALHLPDQKPHQDANTELAQTVGNPQFQQAADFLGQGLQMGQLGAALEQFQLNKAVVEAAKKGDLVEFADKLTGQEIDKQIEQEADEEENAETAQKKGAAAEKGEGDNDTKGQPHGDDNMELD